MRLWHYELISSLPNKMLVSQWRECIAIKRQWEKGTLKHRLVSYVMDYDASYFLSYVVRVCNEMINRKINYNKFYYFEILEFCNETIDVFELDKYKNYPEHNERYLNQCYHNLQEKYDRGIITKKEWENIQEVYYEFI